MRRVAEQADAALGPLLERTTVIHGPALGAFGGDDQLADAIVPAFEQRLHGAQRRRHAGGPYLAGIDLLMRSTMSGGTKFTSSVVSASTSAT